VFNLFQSKPDLIVHSQAAYNAEPPLGRLRLSFITALEELRALVTDA
jgi:hypothetical protein